MDLVPFLSVTPGMNGPLIHRTETYRLTYAPAPPAALAFRRWLGGEAAINAYCHDLAMKGGKRLAQLLGTKVMDETGELTLSMVRYLSPHIPYCLSESTPLSLPEQHPTPAPRRTHQRLYLHPRAAREDRRALPPASSARLQDVRRALLP